MGCHGWCLSSSGAVAILARGQHLPYLILNIFWGRSLWCSHAHTVDPSSIARWEQKLTRLFTNKKNLQRQSPDVIVNHRGHNLTRELRGNNLSIETKSQLRTFHILFGNFFDDFQLDTSGTQPLSSTTVLCLDLQVASPAMFILIALYSPVPTFLPERAQANLPAQISCSRSYF
ncbi:hypothetical protein lerEdw1_015408 [Lerista edwardsae]|nr:hypothetical protein lerEdw1_015408 [Lerista edwardsae]